MGSIQGVPRGPYNSKRKKLQASKKQAPKPFDPKNWDIERLNKHFWAILEGQLKGQQPSDNNFHWSKYDSYKYALECFKSDRERYNRLFSIVKSKFLARQKRLHNERLLE